MSYFFTLIRRIAPLLISLSLVAYLGFLLTDLYRSRSELQQTARARQLDDADKRAQAVGYFFSERVNDLQDLANHREISAYFENLALGMSMEYGLAASLEEANVIFATFQRKKRIGEVAIYTRVVFLDAGSRILLDAHDESVTARKGEERSWKKYVGRSVSEISFFAEGEDDTATIVISVPCIFKEKRSGQILAWLSPANIHRHFLAGGGNQMSSIALLFEKRYLFTTKEADRLIIHKNLPSALNLRERELIRFFVPIPGKESLEMTAFRVSIRSTPFALAAFIPATEVNEESPRRLLGITAGIGLLILCGAVVITRNSIRTTTLNTRLEETGIREKAIAGQNDLLHKQANLLEIEVTERQQAQEELAVKQTQLEILNSTLQLRIDEAVSELRQKDQMMISQSRSAAMGEMIGNIAHQWRQPLNALAMVLGNIQSAHQYNELTNEYLDKTVVNGNRLLQKMSTTITDFSNFFKPDKAKVLFSLREQVNHAVAMVESGLKIHNVIIHQEVSDDVMLTGFPNEFSQVLLNLLANAGDAIKESGASPGTITIRIFEQNSMGCLSLSDNGGGIPADIIDTIFDPYFSTKSMGTGIGLYMSKMIIERSMNGRIEAHNIDGGAEFIIVMPMTD